MAATDVVFVVPVSVTKNELESFLLVLNELELEEDEDELTVEEVLNNPDLLRYLCEEAVEDGVALHDPQEFYSNDGWCDFRDYR